MKKPQQGVGAFHRAPIWKERSGGILAIYRGPVVRVAKWAVALARMLTKATLRGEEARVIVILGILVFAGCDQSHTPDSGTRPCGVLRACELWCRLRVGLSLRETCARGTAVRVRGRGGVSLGRPGGIESLP